MHSSFKPVRSVRFRYQCMRGWLTLVASSASRLGRTYAIGAPIIDVFPGSVIQIGNDVRLISAAFATALGVNHPVLLRTMNAGAKIRIGDRVGISGGSFCAALLIDIGEGTLVGANVTIADTDFHSLCPEKREGCCDIGVKQVVIGKRVFIGANSIVLKGVSIGDNSVIGAGSVVTRDIPSNSIAAGNPCRVLRQLTVEELLGTPNPVVGVSV